MAAHRRRVTVQPVGGGGQSQPQRGQRLAGAIVQFAGDALPLCLLGRDDAMEQFAAHLTALLHLVIERGVLDGDAELIGDSPRQRGVAQAEGDGVIEGAEDETTDDPSANGQGHRQGVAAGLDGGVGQRGQTGRVGGAIGRGRLVAPRQAQRQHGVVDHPRRLAGGNGVLGQLQPLGLALGHRRSRVVAFDDGDDVQWRAGAARQGQHAGVDLGQHADQQRHSVIQQARPVERGRHAARDGEEQG